MRLLGILALAALSALLIGCGGTGAGETVEKRPERPPKLESVNVTIDGLPGPEAAGFFMAQERGYFRDAGLDVLIMAPSTPLRPLWYVGNRTVDIAVSHEPQVVLSREKGAPVVAIGSVVPRSTMAMIWLEKSQIDGIADLRGKTIAYPGVRFQRELLEAVLGRAGLTLDDVKLKRVDYELVPALISGRADAIFGGSGNVEGVELEARGLEPVITPVSDLGVPPYDELVAIARPDRVAKDPELFRRFMAAAIRGVDAAMEDPEAATDAIATYASEYGEVNRKALADGVEATLPLLSKTGEISPGQVTRLVNWMHAEGLIRRKLPTSELLVSPQEDR
jgi:putative hydroxymethylpyrimidine transport system substrate-binding protein